MFATLIRYAGRVRYGNLLILAFVQVLVYFRIIRGPSSVLDELSFVLLVLATMLAGAAGFVINDVYDEATDRINRPDKWHPDKTVSPVELRGLAAGLILSGALLSAWVAWRLDLLAGWWLYPVAIGSLWLYSSRLKCSPLAGNLWVALFTGGVVLLIGMPDMLSGYALPNDHVLWYYAGFAVLTNLYREIIKDIEDVEGDRAAGCGTLVVGYGVPAGRRAGFVSGILLLLGLIVWTTGTVRVEVLLFAAGLMGINVWTLLELGRATHKADYHRISRWIKGIMLAGTVVLFWL